MSVASLCELKRHKKHADIAPAWGYRFCTGAEDMSQQCADFLLGNLSHTCVLQLDSTGMEELFFDDEAHLRKLFTYMCSQCTAPEDPISNTACLFLGKKMFISFGIAGISFFEDGVIYPYFYLTRDQRQHLYTIASSAERRRFCNGCLILTEHNGKSLDQRRVWRVILKCVCESKTHRDCLRMLADVLVQRILCKIQLSKDVVEYVHQQVEQLFEEMNGKRDDTSISESIQP
jgi:hypothetical protein